MLLTHSGGPINAAQGAGNNYPLRGGKHTAFEGGVRLSAFVAGGYLPVNVRGTINTGNIHLADWVRRLRLRVTQRAFCVSSVRDNTVLCLCSRWVCVSLSAALHARKSHWHVCCSMRRFAPLSASTLTTIVPLWHLRL